MASGLISLDDQRHAMLLCARTQKAEDWTTPSGSMVSRGAIADHITLAGEPIIFPGPWIPAHQAVPGATVHVCMTTS